MTRSIIDPITRIEGHLRVEMEVTNGKVSEAWVSGGCFRGMELVVQDRTPEDAAQIVQRICGVCPVSHAHASAIAGEHAYGIKISNNARIIRNLIEGAQFLHSHILWFYNLAALDYVNPLNALTADPADAYDLALAAGTSTNSDFVALKERLTKFADNGQLSIFSGAWFEADKGQAYKLDPELDLICTAHYLEALQMQAKASEVAGLLGGKMPHVMTLIPGGTMWVPTEEKLDDLWALVNEIYNWVEATMIPDTLAIAPAYADALNWGKGVGRYIAWGVFENENMEMNDRYLPAGVLDESLNLSDVEESKITEYMGHSWYKGDETLTSPYFVTEPEFTEYYKEGTDTVSDRYTWVKCPAYDGKAAEAGGLSRVLVAYKRNVPFIVEQVNAFTSALGIQLGAAQSTLGRTAVRQIETLYIAGLMKEWVQELMEALKGGDAEYFRKPETITGEGTGFWEAPRGALYHSEKVENGKIKGYQIIIPSTWNLAPHDAQGNNGPMEEALIGVPVEDIEMPINALRTVHSFDPCTACAVHVTEPATGKSFKTVTSPWGVK
ncbi:nickel-dependent hydrogenase large subunit [Raoultibacter phocaeensis]|uniref:nickel-dependent hydrogenase large subunit n=1 Tax=Raoultibacter phocaeensis TaxID=2479841 RepID=UPI001118FD2C|nr:nickel-dependent hydrogenase large subunit [Raoultibacter phocaeensis]